MVEFVSNNFCGSGFKLKIHDTDTYEILDELCENQEILI